MTTFPRGLYECRPCYVGSSNLTHWADPEPRPVHLPRDQRGGELKVVIRT